MKMWILWMVFPIKAFCQSNWDQVLQPSSILQYKRSNSDPFSSSQYYSCLAFIDTSAIGISIENKYSIKGLSKLNISSQLNTQNGGWGMHFNFIGNNVFNGGSIATAYGIQISKTFGLGFGARFQRENIRGFSPLYIMMPQLGIIYFFSKKMSVGFQVKKFFRPTNKSQSWYKEVVSINTGIGIQIDENFYIAMEVLNQLRNRSSMNMYAEWMPTGLIKSYLLYQQTSGELIGGMQIKINKLNVGMGISSHSYLGSSGFLTMYHVL
jgi:hypothetical protein